MRKDKKEGLFSKKNIIAGFIVLVMVSSIMGFMLGDGDSSSMISEQGIDFNRGQSDWYASINDKITHFDYLPSQVRSINISESTVALLQQTKMVYVTSDEGSLYKEYIAQAQFELGTVLGEHFFTFIQPGFLEVAEDSVLPLIDCENATQIIPVMVFMKHNATEIVQDGNCIFVRAASSFDMLRAKDRILYAVFEII